MALVVKDRVKETSTSTGTGTITLDGAVSGFQAFSVIGDASTTYYAIVDRLAGTWEVGIGTYTSSGTTLSRDTVLSSSNSGNLVNFGVGTKDVFVTQPAERAVYILGAGTGLAAGTAAFVANGVVYANSTSGLTTDSLLSYNGKDLSLVRAGPTWNALYNAIQIGSSSLAVYDYGGATLLAQNAIVDSTGTYKYVNSDYAVRYEQDGWHTWYIAPSGTAGDSITFTRAMFLDSAGNFGLGVFSAQTRFDARAANTLTDSWGTANLGSTDALAADKGGQLDFSAVINSGGTQSYVASIAGRKENATSANYAGYLAFSTRTSGGVNTERMRIDSAGNVTLSAGTANGVAYLNASKVVTSGSGLTFDGTRLGIGVAAPVQRLEVSGSVGVNTSVTPGANGSGIAIYASDFPRLTFRNATTGDTVNDGLQLYMVGANVSYNLLESGYQRWMNNNTEYMRLDSSGNLGIGTSSPGYKLDVAGQGRITESGTGSGDGGFISNTGATNGNAGFLFQTGGTSRWNLTTLGTNGANLRIYNYTLGTTVAIFDSSGNLGLGVTPSAWSGYTALQVKDAALASSGSAEANLTANSFYGALGWTYKQTAAAARYALDSQHRWFTAASGTAGNAITFTQAMTLDASGNLGLGVTPSAWGSSISAFEASYAGLVGATGTSWFINNAYRDSSNTWKYRYSNAAARFEIDANAFKFYTAATGTAGNAITFTQAMTLDASGNLAVGSASAVGGGRIGAVNDLSAANGVVVRNSAAAYANNNWFALFQNNTPTSIAGLSHPAANSLGIWGADDIRFLQGASAAITERARIDSAGNLKLGGTANRGTTAGTNHLDIFNGTAPAGTLTNGISIYSSSGEAYVMDAAGNATLFSPHDAETNEWIFKSKHTPTGKVLKIDVERLLRFVNDHFGLDAVQEFIED